MQKTELSEAPKPLPEYVKEMDGEVCVIMCEGVMLAALVPMGNADYD